VVILSDLGGSPLIEIAAKRSRPARLRRVTLVAALLAFLVLIAGSAVFARAYTLRESVLPGVHVSGLDVGGLDRADARAAIARTLGARLARPVTVEVGERTFTVQPNALWQLDSAATEERAFRAGRASIQSRLGALVAPFAFEREVRPVLELRPAERRKVEKTLRKLTARPRNAGLRMEELEPVVADSREGTTVDSAALIAALEDAALSGTGHVTARVTSTAPGITTAEAEETALRAQTIVAAPVHIRFRGHRVGELGPKELASFIRFSRSDGTYAVTLDRQGLTDAVRPLVKTQTRQPVDASFQVVGTRVRVVRARPGTTLAPRKAQAAVLAAALEPGTREARVGLTRLPADFTTRDAKALGIRRQLSSYTTEMGPSSANRIWNVHLMADYIDGTIIKPGQLFSFNGTVGPRTAARGFREGQMILGSLLVPAIGGGVCQTGTTLFNNAFEVGLPIVERHNHSWYISHYPIGRDATVSWGGPDLKFKNDLDHAILIKSSYTDSTLTFTFYGTRQGRRIDASTGPQVNFRSPQTSYAYDPAAPRGSVRTVSGSKQQGFDITVFRKVYERGKLLRKDSFTSGYIAVGDTKIYGPGTHPPRVDFVLPSV
jgi:vancomycin resistance protein YoaR